jgi:hypothetical protein
MKPPTEGEQIELENWLINEHTAGPRLNSPVCSTISEECAFERIKLLIAIARDPSKLLRTIPDDDALDRSLVYVRKAFPPPVIPRRKAKLEPVLSLQPKQIKI